MNFTFFDAHCDTLEKLTDSGAELRKNSFHVDLERLKLFNGYIQVFAAFVDKESWDSPFKRAMSLVDTYHKEVAKNYDIVSHCTNTFEIQNALSENHVASLLAVEGGEAIEGSLEKLTLFYRKGVRLMSLTWNHANEICDGIGEARGGGLTDFGKSVVSEMNRLGMLIDVSHISVKGFWDVIETSTQPIVATHSNAKRLCGHPRNLDEEQIAAIFSNGGCIGINFYPLFVLGEQCSVDDVVNHIEYFLDRGGENHIGLGSDFDGIATVPNEINGVQDMGKIVDCMMKRGFKDKTIHKITHKNFMRVIKKVLK